MSRSSKIHEDDYRFNPQTMGNKKYKENSEAVREMKARGEYRRPEVPHGSTKGRMGKFDLGPKVKPPLTEAIQRRISSKAKSK